MPTEKYAHAPEILEHCQRIGKQFGLYDNALFHTEVTDLDVGRATRSRWIIRTNRGDDFTAQFVGMGTGPLHVPKLPGIPGIETFARPLVPHQPLGLRLHRRRPVGRADGRSSPTSASPSSAPAPPRCSACRTSPGRARSCTSSSARRRRSTCATTGRPIRSGSRRSPRRAGSSAGSRTSPPTRPAAWPTRTW